MFERSLPLPLFIFSGYCASNKVTKNKLTRRDDYLALHQVFRVFIDACLARMA